ncbi:MAG: glycosyltransferase family 4 protein [Cyclobacteriaceae bacterium]|nr:glycosyltransferase family 4 protein [Cyclobacteriaceae bacterium]
MNNRKLRIGIVLSSVPAYSETFFQTKIDGLLERGFDVILFAKGKKDGLNAKVITPYPVLGFRPAMFIVLPVVLSLTLLKSPRVFFKYVKLLRYGGMNFIQVVERVYLGAHILPYDLDWLHFGFITQAIGKEKLAKAIGAKMAVSIRGFDISVFPLMNPGKLDNVWSFLDKLHTISGNLLAVAKEFGLPDSVRVQKISPAIDVAKFISQKDMFFENFNEVNLITVARLDWKKGLEYALEACLLLKNSGIQFKYTIVGEGGEREKLTYLIHQMGLRNEVSITGRLNQAEIIPLLHKHDVYLQPSIEEGFCNAVLEAQASGLLCIVSDAGGLSENVIDTRTGWVVPKRDSVLLAKKIRDVLKMEKSELERIRNQTMKRIEDEFSLQQHIKSWIRFYSS